MYAEPLQAFHLGMGYCQDTRTMLRAALLHDYGVEDISIRVRQIRVQNSFYIILKGSSVPRVYYIFVRRSNRSII